MNPAHIHLVLNHIPIIAIPVVLAFFIYGIWIDHTPIKRLALLMLAAIAATIIPVYLTGEPAEEIVEHIPGIIEASIEAHEDAGKVSLILTLITGAVALLAFWFQNDRKKARILNFSVMAIAGAAVLSLFYTGNLGGKIRHTELAPENPSSQQGEEESHESE